MKYGSQVKKYFKKDDFIGSFEFEDNSIGTGLVGSPSCGDVMKLQIKIKNNIIIDAKILIFGCGSAKASSALTAEIIIGKTLEEALRIKDKDIAKNLDLPNIKLHCSVLAESAIKKAIADYRKKNNQNPRNFANQIKNFSIDISEKAIIFIKKHLIKTGKNCKGIRLTLEDSNCGLAYKIKYIEENSDTKNDVLFEKDDLKIFVSNEIANIINGTIMDYKQEGLKSGIVFLNPNAIEKCGCGTNFRIEGGKEIDDKDCKT